MLLFEGGKSLDINPDIAHEGVEGAKRILEYFGMLNPRKRAHIPQNRSIYIEKSAWVRAKYSGLFQNKTDAGKFIEKGEVIACITDPFGKFEHKVKAPNSGYIINSNDAPIVFQGDAIFHISQTLTDDQKRTTDEI